jgi:glycosyltransferase involved in cell wall biosynthesis
LLKGRRKGRKGKKAPGPKGRPNKGLDILQLCVRFHPAPGGVETHVLQISKVLRSMGHNVKVLTSDLYKEVPFTKMDGIDGHDRETIEGIEVQRFKARTFGDEMHYVLTPSMLSPLLRTDADIVHAHSYGYFHVNLAAFARRMTGLPFVFTTHFHPDWSMWGGERRRSLRKVYDKLLGRSTLNAADRIIIHTNNELSLMASLGVDEEKVRVIPAGVDISKYTPPPDGKGFRKAFGIDGPFILYAGRLATNKGLNHLVRAFSKVSKEKGLEPLKLVLVGEDHGVRASLEKVAHRAGVSDRVIYTDHISDDDLFRGAFSACELLALPSDYEAFGLVLVEAMACGRPCVATRVGGIPEVVDHGRTGLLVEYGDVKALASALMELLTDDKKARAMGRSGRKRVEERFTWEKVTVKIEDVYKELLH